jgi:hypothetical protein
MMFRISNFGLVSTRGSQPKLKSIIVTRRLSHPLLLQKHKIRLRLIYSTQAVYFSMQRAGLPISLFLSIRPTQNGSAHRIFIVRGRTTTEFQLDSQQSSYRDVPRQMRWLCRDMKSWNDLGIWHHGEWPAFTSYLRKYTFGYILGSFINCTCSQSLVFEN